MFVTKLVIVCHWLGNVCHRLYTGQQKKNPVTKLSKSLLSIWFVADLSEQQLHIYYSKFMLNKEYSSFILSCTSEMFGGTEI